MNLLTRRWSSLRVLLARAAALTVLLAGMGGIAQADTRPVGEDTMMVIQQGTTPEDIVNVIRLPDPARNPVRRDDTDALADAARQARENIGQQSLDGASRIVSDLLEATKEETER